MQPVLHFYDFGEGVTAFSTTRQGGYSSGNYGEFNINRYCGDTKEAIARNRELLCELLGIDDSRLLMPHQVHKTEIVAVDETSQESQLEGVDALMTNVSGLCIGVSTADCIPVLLYDRVHRAVSAIHAGWRGTVKRIVEKTVAQAVMVKSGISTCPRAIVSNFSAPAFPKPKSASPPSAPTSIPTSISPPAASASTPAASSQAS